MKKDINIDDNIKKIIDNTPIENKKDIVTMLSKYIKVSTSDKKTKGEVWTPIYLVEDMLNTLPIDVWSNPNLKWFDSCNGVGTFFSVVIERLMKGLEAFEPDEKMRYRHIVENMLFACELQEDKLSLYCYLFDPKNEYTLNVYCGSYLDEGFDNHMKEIWEVDKFDVIVMNPPYQLLKEGNKKSQPLWNKFVIKTISQLVDGGYLVAVHPDGWRSAKGIFKNVQNLLKERQLLYLEVHNVKDGLKTFGASTPYDFYCLHNVPNTSLTKIKCMDGNVQRVDISKMEFIPSGKFEEFEKLLAKNVEEKVNVLSDCYYHTQKLIPKEEKVNLLYSSSDYVSYKKAQMSKTQTTEHIYPCIYLTYKDGSYKLWYSNIKKQGHFGIPKVIWSNGSSSSPIIDNYGEYGVMQFAYAIIDEPKNLPLIQKSMLNPDFIKLMKYTEGTHRYNTKTISLFRKDFWKEFLK